MGWRISNSLAVLRNEINTKYPDRDKRTDGAISGYPGSISSHNVNSEGVVNAIDVTVGNYPGGITCEQALEDTEAIRLSIKNDPRGITAYVIYEDRIADGLTGEWRQYFGEWHGSHYHVSTDTDILTGGLPSGYADYDLNIPWGLLEDNMPLSDADVAKILDTRVSKQGKDLYGKEGGTTSLREMLAYDNSNRGWVVNEIRGIFSKKIKRAGGKRAGQETTLEEHIAWNDADVEETRFKFNELKTLLTDIKALFTKS